MILTPEGLKSFSFSLTHESWAMGNSEKRSAGKAAQHFNRSFRGRIQGVIVLTGEA
jgi:hypothetical protein